MFPTGPMMCSNQNATYNGQQGNISLMGSNNTLKFRGCNVRLDVMGSNNRIVLEGSNAPSLTVCGSNNSLRIVNSNVNTYSEQGSNNNMENVNSNINSCSTQNSNRMSSSEWMPAPPMMQPPMNMSNFLGGMNSMGFSAPPYPYPMPAPAYYQDTNNNHFSGMSGGVTVNHYMHPIPPIPPAYPPPSMDNAGQRGLTNEQIGMLPKTTHNSSTSIRTCSICIDQIIQGDQETFLFCLHSFHSECVTSWLKKQSVCPQCQTDVKRHLRQNVS